MERPAAVTGLVPVEDLTTRQVGASPEARAADVTAAFADPSIRAVLASVGGDDQITVVPHLDGVLLLETSEELPPASDVGRIVRTLGERGILGAVYAVLLARPQASDFDRRPPAEERRRLRAEQREVVAEVVSRYNDDAVLCAGIPFGHTRPQWIHPHGGSVTVDGAARRVHASYS